MDVSGALSVTLHQVLSVAVFKLKLRVRNVGNADFLQCVFATKHLQLEYVDLRTNASCSYLAVLRDDAEGVFLQEAVVEGEDGRVVQLGQQMGFLRRSDCLVRSEVAQRNLLQHLPERDIRPEVRRFQQKMVNTVTDGTQLMESLFIYLHMTNFQSLVLQLHQPVNQPTN